MLWSFRQKLGDFIKDPKGAQRRLAEKRRSQGRPNLTGDRDVEWAWIAGHIPGGPGVCLDFGPGGSNLGLAAAMHGFDLVSLDLVRTPTPYHQYNTTHVDADILEYSMADESLDLILNCSAIEHVGLSGRYGNQEVPDGDLEAMRQMLNWLKPGGIQLLTIPVGVDAVFPPEHRVYGEQRLPLLLADWEIREEQFWVKTEDKLWHSSERSTALATEASFEFYSLGLFVLARPVPASQTK